MRRFLILLLIIYYSGGQIEKNELGGARNTYGQEMCVQGFVGKT